MRNNTKIVLVLIIIVLVGGYFYSRKGSTVPASPTPATVASVQGCYVSHLAQDVYTLNIKSQVGDNVSGTLAFKNFEKDSSTGTFTGTYKDGTLLALYTFQSEGSTSVLQVIFKKTGDNFVRGYGDMNAAGDRFADVNNINFDPNQTFVPSADCAS